MTLDEEIVIVREQEQTLQFASFNADMAWRIGGRLRERAVGLPKPVAIGIWMAGHAMFYTGTNGITPDSEDWLRRKRNTVLRLGKSTLLVGLELTRAGSTLEAKQGLTVAEYAAHGGGFPVMLLGTGCVGAIVVSGLTQREDHALVVRILGEVLDLPVEHLT